MTSQELAQRILNWQTTSLNAKQLAAIDMVPLSTLLEQYRDAVLEEAAEAVDKYADTFEGITPAVVVVGATQRIRALKGKP